MATVNSVLGPLDTTALGFTLMHEHLSVSSAGIPQNFPELFGADVMERIVSELTQAKQGGVDTIVDATTLDLGRDVVLMAEASRRSGVNVIACTGAWLDLPRSLTGVSADQCAELFIREIRDGIAGTHIKAGIIKAASDVQGMTPDEETVLRGVARAHRQTKVPIMLHSYSLGQVGRQQLAILREEGVNLRMVKVDHSNDTTDLEYLTWLLEQGCYLGMDRYPGRNASPQARSRTMKSLIDAGYGNRLLLSHDRQSAWPKANSPLVSRLTEMRKRNQYGYLYIKKSVFVQLQEMGVSSKTLESLCVDNPRSFFEGT